MLRNIFLIKNKKILFLFLIFSFFCVNNSAQAVGELLTDGFSDSSQWTSSAGAWGIESGVFKQKETGTSYISQTDTVLFNDDFANEAPSTLATPFTEPFTQVDGPATNWTVKRGSLAVSSNTYLASSGGGITMSIPTNAAFSSWTDYRFTTNFKRMGVADASGYSIVYFRAAMDGTNDNSYAVLFRQTGAIQLYKRVGGAYSTLLGSSTITKDNDWHTVTIEIVGSTFKMWLDKDFSTNVPDFAVSGLTDYTSGTIGVGTSGWNSYFDDLSVTTLTSGYQFTEKRCQFWANSGTYYAIPTGCEGIKPLAIITDPTSLNWKNYRITAQVKNLGAAVSTNYSMITFRTTMIGNNDNSYALLLRQDGTADVYEVVNNWASSTLLGTFLTDSDTDYHDVVIEVEGTTVKIWFDRTATQSPNFQYGHLTTYTSGTVGIGTGGAQGVFNSISVDPLVSVQPKPSFLYSGSVNTSSFDINASTTVGDLTLIITNPSQTTWTLTNPAACVGQNNCQVVFPTDFSGANISQLGTYKITVQRGNSVSYSFLEVREQPLATFVQISDTHYDSDDSDAAEVLNQLGYLVADINSQKYFPTPTFVTATGDLTTDGTLLQLSAVEDKFDDLTIPFYPVVGNHDTSSEVGDAMGTIWQTVFGADKFTYSWGSGDIMFLAMDNEAPYGGYGTNLNSTAHKLWLQNILDTNPTKKIILFSHYSLNQPRDGGAAQTFWHDDGAPLVRAILEGHSGGPVVEFAGHDHVNSLTTNNGVTYVTTASLYNNDQYRYVEVYSDKIVSKIIRNDSYSYTQDAQLWEGSTDSTHTASDYSYGLPQERNFEINLSGSQVITPSEAVSLAGNSIWQDYQYLADVTVRNEEIKGQNIAGLVFRYADADNYYSAIVDSAANTVTLRKKVNGVTTNLASQAVTINPDVTYQMEVSALGTSINVSIDDVSLISVTDSTFSSGKIKIRAFPRSFAALPLLCKMLG